MPDLIILYYLATTRQNESIAGACLLVKLIGEWNASSSNAQWNPVAGHPTPNEHTIVQSDGCVDADFSTGLDTKHHVILDIDSHNTLLS